MKQTVLLFILISATSHVFAQANFYRSDWVGLEMEKIERFRIDEFEFVLEVTKETGKTVKILLRNQKEWKRWELVYNERRQKTDEYVYEDKLLVLHGFYDKKGRLKTETVFTAGVQKEKRVFNYSPRGLDFVDTLDADGVRLYTDEYFLAPSGRLRTIRRIYPDGSMAIIHFTYGNGLLVYQWEYRDGRIVDTRYNETGQVVRREERYKDKVEFMKEYAYDPQSGRLASETDSDFVNGKKTERFFDADGRVVREKNIGTDLKPFELIHTYEGGRKVSTRKKSDLGVEEWKYFYKPDGSLSVEEYYKIGFLQMRTVYTASDSWYEEIFRDEELFLRVYYLKEKKVKEEFIQEGNVVRTKDY